jgi:hypothetical protein
MSGSSRLSAAAKLHVVKADPDRSDVIDVNSHPQSQGSGGNAKPRTKGKGKGKNKEKSKGKGKDKDKGKCKAKAKAKAKGNSVRDGSPVIPKPAPAREQAGCKHGADHWDDLRRAWAGYLSQSKKGNQETQQPHHHRHQQSDGQPSGSGSKRGKRGRGAGSGGGGGGQAHAGQKRKAMATNGSADDGGERAVKRRKSARRPSGRGAGESEDTDADVARPHPDFWHPDGSVIVEIEKTRFRLHQSTLQKHSAYFADAFSREKGGGHQGRGWVPNREPLPIYRVAETTAEDFTSLLTVIEEPMCVSPLPLCVRACVCVLFLTYVEGTWLHRIFFAYFFVSWIGSTQTKARDAGRTDD